MNGLKIGMLMYPDHFHNQLNVDHSLLISHFWGNCVLSEPKALLAILQYAWKEWPQVWHAGVA